MGAIRDGYVTAAEAAELSGKGINMISKLCQAGRLQGAEKIGNLWLIPRASIENYVPDKRGPKAKKAKLSAELTEFRAAVETATTGER